MLNDYAYFSFSPNNYTPWLFSIVYFYLSAFMEHLVDRGKIVILGDYDI